MDALPKSRLLQFVERAFALAHRAVSRFSTRYSRKRFTLRQHVVLFCLKDKKPTTCRDLVDEPIEMPRICETLNLDVIPAPSILCKAFTRLELAVCRVLLNASLADLPLNGVTGIDTSGFERTHASAQYTRRTNFAIQQLETMLHPVHNHLLDTFIVIDVII